MWQRILQVRSLVLTPSEDIDTWISFADLCRTSDRLNLAEKTLTSLVGQQYHANDPESRQRAPPPVIFAWFKLAWAKNQQEGDRHEKTETLINLRQFTNQLSNDIGVGGREADGRLMLPDEKLYGEYTRLLARCYVELGQWQVNLMDGSFGVGVCFTAPQ